MGNYGYLLKKKSEWKQDFGQGIKNSTVGMLSLSSLLDS